MMKPSVLFVCLGNICRSPTAHALFEHLVQREGLQDRIQIDSAGTGGWHIGKGPDSRAQAFAAKRGYDMAHLRAREVSPEDFASHDLILAMDKDNKANLLAICPPEHRHKVRMFLEFAEGVSHQEVPDPYYGGDEGFELVLDLVERACVGLLQYLRAQYL